jgi:hypothetical protein
VLILSLVGVPITAGWFSQAVSSILEELMATLQWVPTPPAGPSRYTFKLPGMGHPGSDGACVVPRACFPCHLTVHALCVCFPFKLYQRGYFGDEREIEPCCPCESAKAKGRARRVPGVCCLALRCAVEFMAPLCISPRTPSRYLYF